MNELWPEWKENKLFTILVAGLVIIIIVVMVTVFIIDIKKYHYIGKPEAQRDTITIDGTGKVTGIPDIANIELGLQTEKKNVSDAQKENTLTMNKLVDALKSIGIDKKDIQTSNYSIYPQYDWLQGGKQVLRGYQVSQSVTVKIRDLNKVSDVISKAGELGLNQVGGLTFTMDDPEALKVQAREKALANAKEKADALAKIMDVKLGKVVSFSENSSNNYPMPKYMAYEGGIGGGATAVAPDVQAGSLEVVVNAVVQYEIK